MLAVLITFVENGTVCITGRINHPRVDNDDTGLNIAMYIFCSHTLAMNMWDSQSACLLLLPSC